MRLCSMRAASDSWTSLKRTPLLSVAECTLIGTAMVPRLMVPFQIDRAATEEWIPVWTAERQ